MKTNTPLRWIRVTMLTLILGAMTPHSMADVIDGKGNDTFPAFDALYLGPDGRSLIAGVTLACTEGELYQLRATFNQRSTATLASGRDHGICTGEAQRFTLRLDVPEDFDVAAPGDAGLVGLVITRNLDTGTVTDSHQWQKDVTVE